MARLGLNRLDSGLRFPSSVRRNKGKITIVHRLREERSCIIFANRCAAALVFTPVAASLCRFWYKGRVSTVARQGITSSPPVRDARNITNSQNYRLVDRVARRSSFPLAQRRGSQVEQQPHVSAMGQPSGGCPCGAAIGRPGGSRWGGHAGLRLGDRVSSGGTANYGGGHAGLRPGGQAPFGGTANDRTGQAELWPGGHMVVGNGDTQ
ncbi:hypothetical protein GUJ93_ZPchr0010g10553 [Zizania palustris]|uniref:Uncharacterized protein n=1 Tax=Zizania palustris TaxID=103762 RepID=A0A8J5W931_ZIZPA|nr:hypothetical protein GUJ93_ZPchr0010g10553 [Zizania palustris]